MIDFVKHQEDGASRAEGADRAEGTEGTPATDGPLQRRLAAWRARPDDGPVIVDDVSLRLYALAARAAQTTVPILVSGPSGSGKEVMARFIHGHSPRASHRFLALNCAALPDAMLESLLFGHARGAFTGAATAAEGLFRAADGGTLFLDELGELSLAMQAKLLRAVEQQEVLPLGETISVKVDVRIVAATNRDLAVEVAEGRFRADLYWRLAAFPLALEPLSRRPGDIVPLVARLLPDHPISEDALQQLLARDWPGNVRELAHMLQRAVILAQDAPIGCAHLPAAAPPIGLPARVKAAELQAVRAAVIASGSRRDAARRLGISERSLRYKLAALAGRPRPTERLVLA